eukprot:12273288-Ditylum_brightwellii.AAC.1
MQDKTNVIVERRIQDIDSKLNSLTTTHSVMQNTHDAFGKYLTSILLTLAETSKLLTKLQCTVCNHRNKVSVNKKDITI